MLMTLFAAPAPATETVGIAVDNAPACQYDWTLTNNSSAYRAFVIRSTAADTAGASIGPDGLFNFTTDTPAYAAEVIWYDFDGNVAATQTLFSTATVAFGCLPEDEMLELGEAVISVTANSDCSFEWRLTNLDDEYRAYIVESNDGRTTVMSAGPNETSTSWTSGPQEMTSNASYDYTTYTATLLWPDSQGRPQKEAFVSQDVSPIDCTLPAVVSEDPPMEESNDPPLSPGQAALAAAAAAAALTGAATLIGEEDSTPTRVIS